MEKSETIRYWLNGSKENHRKARSDFESGDFVYALFWLHLACEKLIKAKIIESTEAPAPHSHDLVHLATKTGLEINADQKEFLRHLTAFQLEVRYPEDFARLKEEASDLVTRKLFTDFDNFSTWLRQTS